MHLFSNQITNHENAKVKLAFKIKINKLIFYLKKSDVKEDRFEDHTLFSYYAEYSYNVKYDVNVVDNYGLLLENLENE